uniref:EF-hand domain-containing protein n=1 Tax=Electrophorus electricus TaxID=8005 RepID=A0AAY5EZ05_ELEEL
MQTCNQGRLEALQIYKLLQFVREGSHSQVEKMVQLGVPNLINLTEPAEGTGALHLASVANDLNIAQFLLSLGAYPNVQDKRGRTPVILATELGYDSMVDLLAKNHANMNVVDNEGKGALFYCISPSKRHMRCLQVVLNSKANVNNVSNAGKPVFLMACERATDCENICMSILERGADPNAMDQATGRTALMEAARAGATALVRAILQRGGNPNALDKKRQHAAHEAAKGGFFEVIQVLSGYSADLGVIAKGGNTPLHLAAAGGYTDCCRFLAQRGCNPKLKNLDGLVPRQLAKDNGHRAALKELKKAEHLHTKFSKPGSLNPNELWALVLHDWACEHESVLRKAFEEAGDHLDIISTETFRSVLQEHHAPIDQENLQKIIMAHDKKQEGIINISDFFKGLKYLQKAFVQSSYAPKKKKAGKGGKGKKKGKTAPPLPICTMPPELMARREDGGPPRFMIERYQQYTDTRRFNRDRPPIHPVEDDSAWYMEEPEKIYTNINYCVKMGDFESLCLAFSQNVPMDVKDRFYKTPLMAACSSGSYQMAQFLITADVNACDQFNWTPLHHACHAGQMDIIELLVQSGAMVDAVALNGATPLMRAIESCRLSCVDYLIGAGAKVQAQNKKDQNCLDIARVYGDERIIDLVRTKLDCLPKLTKDTKKGKEEKPSSKSKAAFPVSTVLPATAEKRVNLKENIITMNPHVTIARVADKLNISFAPKTVWGRQLASSAQHMERRMERRKNLSYEVDFKDFLMPFNKNILKIMFAINDF